MTKQRLGYWASFNHLQDYKIYRTVINLTTKMAKERFWRKGRCINLSCNSDLKLDLSYNLGFNFLAIAKQLLAPIIVQLWFKNSNPFCSSGIILDPNCSSGF